MEEKTSPGEGAEEEKKGVGRREETILSDREAKGEVRMEEVLEDQSNPCAYSHIGRLPEILTDHGADGS